MIEDLFNRLLNASHIQSSKRLSEITDDDLLSYKQGKIECRTISDSDIQMLGYTPNAKKYKLMRKMHWSTGMNYLCITSKDNYIKYRGSGKRWMRILNKDPSPIMTELLFSSDCYEEFIKYCHYYSEFWDIVENEDFANLIPEEGYGKINMSKYNKEFLVEHGRRFGKNSVKNKLGIHDPKNKNKRTEWAKLVASSLTKETRGGYCSNNWVNENRDKQKENAIKGGRIGGKIVGKMFWWNNGIINKKSYECPEGFVRGMLMSDKKRKQVYNVWHNKSGEKK